MARSTRPAAALARLIVSLTLLSVVGCHVWRDYALAPDDDDVGSNTDSSVDPAAWWDAAYPRRAAIVVLADSGADGEFVLPVVVESSQLEDARPDRADLRIVFQGNELPAEVVPHEGGAAVWARFPRSPRSTDTVHLYWGNPDAPLSPSPWDGYSGAFHFEGESDNSVPGGDDLTELMMPGPGAGRLGQGVEVNPRGSLRFIADRLSETDVVTVSFSFNGRDIDGRSVVDVPTMPCRFLRIDRTDDRQTAVVWTDPTTCTGNDDPESSAAVAVDLTDGAWHDVMLVWDASGGTLALFVDDEVAELDVEPVSLVAQRVDFKGPGDGSLETFAFDEILIDSRPRGADEAQHLRRAIDGELFEIGASEAFADQ